MDEPAGEITTLLGGAERGGWSAPSGPARGVPPVGVLPPVPAPRSACHVSTSQIWNQLC